MQKSLYWRLTLAFVLVAVVTAALVAVFVRITSNDRLTRLIQEQQISGLQEVLGEYYSQNGSWNGVADQWRQLQNSSRPTPAGPTPALPPTDQRPDDRRRSLFGLADASGVVVVSVDQQFPVGFKLPPDELKKGTPVTQNGATVGTILTMRQLTEFNPEEMLFLARTNQALALAMIVALIAALLMAVPLARTMTRPLQALTRAAQNIADGQLEQQVTVNSSDEIGQLAAAFNRMSQEVARGNHLRRQMTADIAHDLRTPLTVIGGYVESMRDGVLQPTPARLALIYSEIERLQRLVGDLRMLSQADAGELSLMPQLIAPQSLLERTAAVFQHQAGQQGVELINTAESDLPQVRLDDARMLQVLDNLLSNALRYTPPQGRVTLSARRVNDEVVFSVQDTGEGIAPEELPNIFQRFYRVDSSRHSDGGESGLGLAIVKAITEAQGGRVWAESTPGQGTTMYVAFPVGE